MLQKEIDRYNREIFWEWIKLILVISTFCIVLFVILYAGVYKPQQAKHDKKLVACAYARGQWIEMSHIVDSFCIYPQEAK